MTVISFIVRTGTPVYGGNDGLSAIFSKRAQVPYLKSLFYEACDLYLNFNGNMFTVACNPFSGHSP